MVTAILIPIIILYFLWISIKETKEHEIKWREAGIAKEEAVIIGTIVSVSQEKQRFYYHRYLLVQELMVKTPAGLVKVRINTPLTKNTTFIKYESGQPVKVYGSWQDTWFHANRVETSS
ncbi:hypothetical protein A8F94_11820 [Bacillus sp. FJAT-27225]|uniref:hypothetical protein n=1 Tax=Bacillus sp. FJAT-27225 TaxID=1743144 RepID=UPI00080C328D|nr:hypothetical protein [Bacillus sp. FJAT-27225]OCA85567.1 hypothetical protein A8F94_11820 [Bacillus sp. FJAT-27225]